MADTGASALPIVFSAVDDGAVSLATAPNSIAMAAAFDSAAGSLALIDFESGFPVGVSASPETVTSDSVCGALLCGYNTTVGGSQF